jgi:predicted metalloprotease
MGPFYCPLDQKVYLDTSFFQDLERRFRACDVGSKDLSILRSLCDCARDRTSCPEPLGVLPQVQQAQRGMARQRPIACKSGRAQADCFAGIWANRAHAKWQFIEPGDVEAALQTASAIGDDRLQKQSRGYVVPDAFTHGSSAQRTRWFMTGLKSGSVSSCDTFRTEQL